MAAAVARQVSLELAETSHPDKPLQATGEPFSVSKQPVALEQEQLSLRNAGEAKKPLSFYMTFLALSICVLLVSLDATALSVAVPVSSTTLAMW